MNTTDKQIDLIGDAYKNYEREFEKGNAPGRTLLIRRIDGKKTLRKLSMEDFTLIVKTDEEFSQRWGITIETKELSDGERIKLYEQKTNLDTSFFPVLRETLDFHNIPIKLTTITYNGQIQEIFS